MNPKRYTYAQFAGHASRARWAKIPPEKRADLVPHNGGRKRTYPPCPKYKAHQFRNDRCPCGYIRERTERSVRGPTEKVAPPVPGTPTVPDPTPNAHVNGANSVSIEARERSAGNLTPEQAKAIIRGLVVQYGLHWGEDVPASALELLEQAARVLTDEQKRELFLTMRQPSQPPEKPMSKLRGEP